MAILRVYRQVKAPIAGTTAGPVTPLRLIHVGATVQTGTLVPPGPMT
jgi:hypothetical protein